MKVVTDYFQKNMEHVYSEKKKEEKTGACLNEKAYTKQCTLKGEKAASEPLQHDTIQVINSELLSFIKLIFSRKTTDHER